ncbi:MAG: hypothetical protein JW741_14945 [Sedimentisphaerales bacterium]|nr:hypothetical protein [Sedimentisphaerales bacterium]
MEGRRYRDYFRNAESYTITNYKAEVKGMQGFPNEIFLDLEQDLPGDLVQAFDTVFNHTTLEHIYHFQTAFSNLCRMTTDVVIIVLPFLQKYHSDYGDYWRFSPLAVKRLFDDNGLEVVYQSFNSHRMSSVYTFTIAARHPEKWTRHFNWTFTCVDAGVRGSEPYIGSHAIPNFRYRLHGRIKRTLRWPGRWMRQMVARKKAEVR